MFKRMPNASQGERFKNVALVSSLLAKVMLAAVKDKPGVLMASYKDSVLLVGRSPDGGQVVLCSLRLVRNQAARGSAHVSTLFLGLLWTSTSPGRQGGGTWRNLRTGPPSTGHIQLQEAWEYDLSVGPKRATGLANKTSAIVVKLCRGAFISVTCDVCW